MARAPAGGSAAAGSGGHPKHTYSKGLGSRMTGTFTWLALSTATFACLITPRKKEWVDICLDYCYAKRALYVHTIYDRLFATLKKMAK